MWNHKTGNRFFVCLIGVCAVISASSEAAVVNADANGFTVTHQVSISADRKSVYKAAIENIDSWWHADHTFSGDATNLYFDARVQGCFCESLGQGAGVVHMTVTFINPGVMLRLTGGLGPLGLMGVAGNMTWEFNESDEGTTVKLSYAVGGYREGGLDNIAGAVDGVLIEAMTRLESYVETGNPESAESP